MTTPNESAELAAAALLVCSQYRSCPRDLKDDITTVLAALASAQRDANRLTWLEREYNWKKIHNIKAGIFVNGINEWQPSVRTAIDAAMKATTP